MSHTIDTAFVMGKDDFYKGYLFGQNPFDEEFENDFFLSWQRGWSSASEAKN